jgi:hypothetical protein
VLLHALEVLADPHRRRRCFPSVAGFPGCDSTASLGWVSGEREGRTELINGLANSHMFRNGPPAHIA